VREGLEAKFGSAESAVLSWKPQNTIELDADSAGTMLKLIDALEDNDDVQNVSSNFEIDDDVLAQLAG
jgi:transcriptional/translational regulatory protein YebC/TACO1